MQGKRQIPVLRARGPFGCLPILSRIMNRRASKVLRLNFRRGAEKRTWFCQGQLRPRLPGLALNLPGRKQRACQPFLSGVEPGSPDPRGHTRSTQPGLLSTPVACNPCPSLQRVGLALGHGVCLPVSQCQALRFYVIVTSTRTENLGLSRAAGIHNGRGPAHRDTAFAFNTHQELARIIRVASERAGTCRQRDRCVHSRTQLSPPLPMTPKGAARPRPPLAPRGPPYCRPYSPGL